MRTHNNNASLSEKCFQNFRETNIFISYKARAVGGGQPTSQYYIYQNDEVTTLLVLLHNGNKSPRVCPSLNFFILDANSQLILVSQYICILGPYISTTTEVVELQIEIF